MKDLVKNRFPFVLKADEDLNEEELNIKRIYENKPIQEKTETDQLREIHEDEPNTRRKSK